MPISLQYEDLLPPVVKEEFQQLVYNLQQRLKSPTRYTMDDLGYSTNGVAGDTWLRNVNNTSGIIRTLDYNEDMLLMDVVLNGNIIVTTANHARIILPGGLQITDHLTGVGGACMITNNANQGFGYWFAKSTNPPAFRTDSVYFRPPGFALATGSLEIIACMLVPVTRG